MKKGQRDYSALCALYIGPLTNLINYVHDRGGYEGGDGDNFGVFSCGENDGENDGENTVKLL